MRAVSRKAAATCGAVLGMLAASVPAAELSYGIDVGAGYDDNITRVSGNEQDDTILAVGGDLHLDHESARMEASIASRLEYRDYLDDSFASEVVGNFIAESKFDIVEERFAWLLSDTFGQSSRDQLSADTPANRESVNFFSTGPDLELPFGSRNTFVVRGLYSNYSYEDSELGNDRVNGELALQRELSTASILSLNATTEKVSFDNQDLYSDFDRNEGFLAYVVDAARTQMSLQGGVTETRSAGETNDDWLGRFKMTRQASSALKVGVELGHEFSDAGSSFVQMQEQQPGSMDPVSVQQTAAPFLNEYVEVFSQFMRNRTGMDLRAGVYDETYEGVPQLDRKRLKLELNLQRSLSPTLTARASANYSSYDYSEISRKFSELEATMGLSWLLGRVTSLSIDYTFSDRNDDDSSDEYRANEVWLRFGYQVGQGASGGASSGL